jgi:hypothetical protein
VISPSSREIHDFPRSRGFIDVIVEPPLIEREVLEGEDRFVLVYIRGVPSIISIKAVS